MTALTRIVGGFGSDWNLEIATYCAREWSCQLSCETIPIGTGIFSAEVRSSTFCGRMKNRNAAESSSTNYPRAELSHSRYSIDVGSKRQPLLFTLDESPSSTEPSGHDVSIGVGRSVEEFRGMITALAPWFGSNRMLGPEVGRHVERCEWVGIPFAGGMCEVPHIPARTIVVNDLHNAIITLARVTADDALGPALYRKLRRKLLHPTELHEVQDQCRLIEASIDETRDQVSAELMLDWAEHYFTAVWMARASEAGTDRELDASLALRWEAGGGDSAKRYQNAIRSLNDWRRTLRRATFSTLDVFAFLEKCKDVPKHGIYCDQPFPGPGDKYKHKFDDAKTARLAKRLAEFQNARIVCRFYDHPLVRKSYPESLWMWHHLSGRKQTNKKAPEVLLVRN